jgi:hypothetical protein
MTHDDWEVPRFSDEAIAILGQLDRAGAPQPACAPPAT